MGLLNALIEQAKNPRGFVGNIMIKIMNQAHTSITVQRWIFWDDHSDSDTLFLAGPRTRYK
ncbi:hypothetical protein D3C76_1711450 [compost metagenome]|jgi:hypothetical protein|uniref:hypothetical protein n=1 Tax=Paenibacillus odorifer TaxID=189426 RepID=UPI00096D8A0F|nr:hypothetical protein [Paenibacillus sp. PastH-4]MDH6442534.1 hypothetical protein [Paenibacillus sp. PastF-4]MDH6526754.1 hypothetical protein [Paenibacillus sp. PastH-3]OMD69373.1 hypothetical protein BSK62_00330 [Paenibacillus odorifer]